MPVAPAKGGCTRGGGCAAGGGAWAMGMGTNLRGHLSPPTSTYPMGNHPSRLDPFFPRTSHAAKKNFKTSHFVKKWKISHTLGVWKNDLGDASGEILEPAAGRGGLGEGDDRGAPGSAGGRLRSGDRAAAWRGPPAVRGQVLWGVTKRLPIVHLPGLSSQLWSWPSTPGFVGEMHCSSFHLACVTLFRYEIGTMHCAKQHQRCSRSLRSTPCIAAHLTSLLVCTYPEATQPSAGPV